MARARSALPFALLCLCAACALEQPRPMPAEAARGSLRVHAADQDSAERALADAELALVAVRKLPGLRERGMIEIRITAAGRAAPGGATRWRGDLAQREQAWIELALGGDPEEQRFLLGHELTHALLDPTWQALPQVVEEGLADHAGEQASPTCGASRRLAHAIRLCSWTGPGLQIVRAGRPAETLCARLDLESLPEPLAMLELDGRSYHDVKPAENRELLYALGYLIVERIGVAKLRELCVAAGKRRLGPAELFDAAQLDPHDKRSWTTAIEALVGAPELAALARREAQR